VIDLNFHRCGCSVFGDVHGGLNDATGWLSHLTKSEYLWVAAFRRIDDGITTSLTNIMQCSHWELQMMPLPTLKSKLSCNVDLVLFP
jgi:hypothetical protein